MEETLHHLRAVNFFGTCTTPPATPRFNIAMSGPRDIGRRRSIPGTCGHGQINIKAGGDKGGGTHMGRRKTLSDTHHKVVQSFFHQL